MLATSCGSTSPAMAALAAASAAAWCGWPPGTSLIAMLVVMSHDVPRSFVTSRRWSPPNAEKKPRGISRTFSSATNPFRAASAAWMPSIAESPAWYSRATLVLAATTRPPMEVAASAIACVICAGVSARSVPAATAPPKIVEIEPWNPRSPRPGVSASAVEPHGRFRRSGALSGKLADDSRGHDVHAHRRARDRAGDHHSRTLEGERWQVVDARARHEARELARDAHRFILPGGPRDAISVRTPRWRHGQRLPRRAN